MIKAHPIGYDVKFRCDTCNITDNFYSSFSEFIDSYKQAHEGHTASMNIETRFVYSDPDWISPYPCTGCEECS